MDNTHRMTVKEGIGHLEELAQGFDEGEFEVLGQTAYVVVGLDHVAVLLPATWWRAGLYDIRIQRSLHPEQDLTDGLQ